MKILHAGDLKGPRSFFTDFDPNDTSSCKQTALRNLKLQLLTRKSTMIHHINVFLNKISPPSLYGTKQLGNPIAGGIMGLVSTLGALPEITAPISESLSKQINNRTAWIEKFINSNLVGHSKTEELL